jgi:acylphosphatase
MKKSFEVFGKVQGIMFRQTLMRSCKRRGILAGATNDADNRERVTFSLDCKEEDMTLLCNDLISLENLNSWGAHANSLNELSDFIEFSNHQVTTENVDEFKWTEGVEFFL